MWAVVTPFWETILMAMLPTAMLVVELPLPVVPGDTFTVRSAQPSDRLTMEALKLWPLMSCSMAFSA